MDEPPRRRELLQDAQAHYGERHNSSNDSGHRDDDKGNEEKEEGEGEGEGEQQREQQQQHERGTGERRNDSTRVSGDNGEDGGRRENGSWCQVFEGTAAGLELCLRVQRLAVLDATRTQVELANAIHSCAHAVAVTSELLSATWAHRMQVEVEGGLSSRAYVAHGKMQRALPIIVRTLRLLVLVLLVELRACMQTRGYGCYRATAWYCARDTSGAEDDSDGTPGARERHHPPRSGARCKMLRKVLQLQQNMQRKAQGLHWDVVVRQCGETLGLVNKAHSV